MDWIANHSGALNFAVNLGMFFVWVAYLQLFLMTYLRARKPRLIINRGTGSDVDSLCLVSNMSEQPVYPQNVFCTIHHAGGACSATITDRDLLQKSAGDERPRGITSQGPLSRGGFMSMGTFRNMLEITAEMSDDCPGDLMSEPDQIESMEILVIAAFGGDDLEIAAKRTYRIDTGTDPWEVIPIGPDTKQVASRSERKQIRRMIESELADAA
ncbi:hypothetical protein ATO6_01655 [Oceanicola sp. 22II-s10i]|uniref:hypothetical protein n=1 Tax=Oceanicola sp. 22II-s10i TaxID=1317116 RepID=UPI000B520C0E|nr:hypothetical protein [Oceanicola sp. 22II-s10i]OWU85661.1 hypothetical protein ATO6_01655 [Oceanicola sp. 22II-s10i]